MTCKHNLHYRQSPDSEPRCVECDPPDGRPFKIGLLQNDGSLVDYLDLAMMHAESLRVDRDRRLASVIAGLGLEDFEVLPPPQMRNGWPVKSKPAAFTLEELRTCKTQDPCDNGV
jgi:hypothetical protein